MGNIQSRDDSVGSKSTVLVVDDEPFNREIMEEILEDEFDVTYASSGPECLEIVKKNPPSVILLDINMPGMSGYEVCQQIKQNRDTENISITFVSALDTLAERLAGYEVGGDDYITKPFEAKELITKLKVSLRNNLEQQKLKENANNAINTAFEAMTSTSEIGCVLQFLRASFECEEYQTLAERAIEYILAMGLRATVQIRVGNDLFNASGDGVVNQLETTVLKRIYNEDRIIDLGNRSVINYEHVSVLVKGMPENDAEKYGRIKDNIALLAEGAEARIAAITIKKDMERQRAGLVKMVNTTRTSLEKVSKNHELNKIKCMKILADLISKVEGSFSFLGLSENQEEAFMKMVNDAVQDTITIYEEGYEVGSELGNVLLNVQDLLAEKYSN